MALNIVTPVQYCYPYPFILLHQIFIIQGTYAAPIILMRKNGKAQERGNRQTTITSPMYKQNIKLKLYKCI